MDQRTALVLLLAVCVGLSTDAQSAPSVAPSAGPVSQSANTTGSLGYLCSSEDGLQTALQAAAANTGSGGLNVTVPAQLATPDGLQQVAQIAWNFIVTYPLPLIAKSLAGASANGTAINTFHLANDHLANQNDTGGVTPNHDTLYNQAFLDLSEGPQVVTVPQFDTDRRYWIVPFLDAYLNFYGAVGSHFNSSAGDYLVVGPDEPAGATYGNFTEDRIFRSPTDLNWVIGRVLVLNDTDLARAYTFSKAYKISSYNPAVNVSLNASSPASLVSRAVNGSGYGTYKNSVGFLDGFTLLPEQWFNASSDFLTADPPVNGSTSELVTTLDELSQDSGAAASDSAYQLGQEAARQCILTANLALVTNTGWTFSNASGIYTTEAGTDYLQRAQDTRFIPAALPATEVIYFQNSRDSEGRVLDASSGDNYTITFPLPLPAKAFWSLTIYNSTNLLLFQNPIDRYSIGDRTENLLYSGANNDTLEVFISASQPETTDRFRNWLPAPTNAPFQFILRTYLPPASAIAGEYAPPPIVRVPSAASSSASSAGR